MERIYLDYNATSPLHPVVCAEIMRVAADHLGNASSRHSYGRRARTIIENARAQIAELFGVAVDEIYFTSGGTESNNLVMSSCGAIGPVTVSAIEHASILEPFRRLLNTRREQRAEFRVLAVDAIGQVVDAHDENVQQVGADSPSPSERNGILSVQWVNSETGVVQDLERIASVARARRQLFHTDGAQAFFRLPTRMAALGVDAATITAHKSFGPQGVGVLYLRRGIVLEPLCVGGPQERRVRPGTENVLAIHGMGVLAKLARSEELWPLDELRVKRAEFWSELATIERITRITPEAGSFPGVLCVALPDLSADVVLSRLDQLGIAASSGSACAAGGQEPSHVLKAMGLPEDLQRGALRFSFGGEISREQLRTAAARTSQVVRDLRRAQSVR
ncbi:MAG: cysteine desulfurase family protein [Planctomycetota bacterium]